MHLGEANIIIVQKSKDQDKWAHVLLNIKYKYFKTNVKDKNKLSLILFTHQKDLVLYFEDDKKARMVEVLIKENKRDVLLKELVYFNERVQTLMELLKIK